MEKAGGKVVCRYYTRFAVRQIVAGKMDPVNSLESRFEEGVARAGGVERVLMDGGKEEEHGVASFSPTSTEESPIAAEKGGNEETGSEETEQKKESKENVVVRRKQYLYRLPDPIKRKDLEYYRDPAHRGYLAHTVADGQSPSLFWKVPKVVEKGQKAVVRRKKGLAENRIF